MISAPRFHGVFHHLHIFRFHLNFHHEGGVLFGGSDRLFHAARSADMIIFEQNGVRKVIAVAAAAPDAHGVFFEYAHIGRGLARIHEADPRPFQQTAKARGVRGDAGSCAANS